MSKTISRLTFMASAVLIVGACTDTPTTPLAPPAADVSLAVAPANVDATLQSRLREAGFTGHVGTSLERRLRRGLNRKLADVGRLVFFDQVTGLNDDNSCSGCHGPQNSFFDAKSIAIGVENNGFVGPSRSGPRNQRRSPTIVNAAFYPALMWNSRFESLSGDSFDNSAGFHFPAPEGLSLSHMDHLLGAQGFIPFTERVEMAGFDFVGNNDDIRNEVLRRLNAIPGYRTRFGQVFPEVAGGQPINFDHVGASIAEFSFSLVFANAPIDRYARGDVNALTDDQKRGALLFFGKAKCVQCHAVSGKSNEMFSDFRRYAIGVPQIAPSVGNVVFDGPGQNEDLVWNRSRRIQRIATSSVRLRCEMRLASQPSCITALL